MKLFSAINDMKPYNGMSLNADGSIGVLNKFCSPSDGIDYPRPPAIYSGTEIMHLNPRPERIYIPHKGIYGLILEADVIAKPMSFDHPLLIQATDARKKDYALVYWAIDLQRAKALTDGVGYLFGEVRTIEQYILSPWLQILFWMKNPSKGILIFDDNTRIVLDWDGRDLQLTPREEIER